MPREITEKEVGALRACIQALSEHHNRVSVNFKGSYPSRPYEQTLDLFREALHKHDSHIAVVEENEQIVGFCKVDFHGEKGKLDYLVVLEEARKKGYGRCLMDWAMQMFEENHVRQIEVKVVDGNDTIHLYEAYGFQMNAHILVADLKK